MKDLRLNAQRIILAIQTLISLNGLLWYARTVNNCNLVQLPHSVLDLLVMGENREFNFVESSNPLNVRKEVENCLPAAFQFWTIPKIQELLDERIKILVFGGNLLKETDDNEPSNQGILIMLRRTVKHLRHISIFNHFDKIFLDEIWWIVIWKKYVQ